MNIKYSLASSSASGTMHDLEMHPRKQAFFRRPRTVGMVIAVVLVITLGASTFWTHYLAFLSEPYGQDAPASTNPSPLDAWNTQVLSGPPAVRFRDALRPDVKYITSWPAAGWTNDVMTMFNLIYLGIITERIPIIPPFSPSHVLADGAATNIAFGDVFDVPRMRELMGSPILEWRDVKNVEAGDTEEIGCWNIWESVQLRESHPRHSSLPGDLRLDISYTKAPSWIKLLTDYEHDPHATFWSLARLAYPETRDANLVPPLQSPNNVTLPPDEHLLCYDYLYYVCAQQPFEYEWEYAPAWRFVGQHAHYTPALMSMAKTYVNRALGLSDNDVTPRYISIHVRHNDFGNACANWSKEDCFAPLSAFARRVQEVKDELLEKHGLAVHQVIMTSDEREPSWWEDVAAVGWARPDHSQTMQSYGTWYPVLIDAAIQAGGHGFVGTKGSTMSIIAARRVAAWQGGATRYVNWGFTGADDH